jgi:phage shock protein C
MVCPHCHKDIVEGSKFCYNCGTPLAAGATAPAPAPKRLMRSSQDKRLGGVCAGVADYFDLDPTIVRVVWLLAVLFGGTGLLLYVVLWIVLPLAPSMPTVIVPSATPQV